MKQAGLLCIPKVHSLHGTPSPSRSFQPTPPQQRRFDVEPERCNGYSSLICRPARRTPPHSRHRLPRRHSLQNAISPAHLQDIGTSSQHGRHPGTTVVLPLSTSSHQSTAAHKTSGRRGEQTKHRTTSLRRRRRLREAAESTPQRCT